MKVEYKVTPYELLFLYIDKLDIPEDAIKEDIKNKYLSYRAVFVNDILNGFILYRLEYDYFYEKHLVINHVISVSKNLKIYNVLGETLPDLARYYSCDIIRHHADKIGMIRMLSKWNYYPSEIVFIKKVEKCQLQDHQALTVRIRQLLHKIIGLLGVKGKRLVPQVGI